MRTRTSGVLTELVFKITSRVTFPVPFGPWKKGS